MTDPPRPARGSRAIARGLKLLVTIVVVALVLGKVDLRELAARLGALDATAIAALSAITLTQVTVGVARWWRLLRRLGERVAFADVYGDVAVGLTFNLFLPTSVGGDVIRALRARGRVAAPHHAWSTSIFERIAGLVAMATTGAAAVMASASTSAAIPLALRELALALSVGFVLVFFVASTPFRILVRLLEARLPAAAVRDLRGIVADLEGPLRAPAARIEALAWSVVGQALALVYVVAGAVLLGASGHTRAVLIGMPLVFVLSMVPLTVGGHGLREGLYVGVLGALGVPADVALGLAALWLASSLAFALAGAVVLLVERRRPVTPVRENARDPHQEGAPPPPRSRATK